MTLAHPALYEPWNLGNLVLRNRLVASAMFDYAADNGHITDRYLARYHELARGGAGLIITGMHAVSHGGSAAPIMVDTSCEDFVPRMAATVRAVHDEGARLLVQLQHAGYRTDWKNGADRLGPSPREVAEGCTYHEASPAELAGIVEDFGRAAARCREAGCDGVQIHAAHGFLLNSFLAPSLNRRTDDYGGPIQNRARLLLEVYESILRHAGRDFVVAVKFPFSDLTEPSITPEESLWACRELERRGLDLLEISSGLSYAGPDTFAPRVGPGTEGRFLESAELVADAVRIPVISVCGYRSPAFIEQTLRRGRITAVALGRPLVREPDLPNIWRHEDRPALCVSCNGCFASQGVITCAFNRKKN